MADQTTATAVDYTIYKGDVLPALVVTPETALGTDVVASGTASVTITNASTGQDVTPLGTAAIFPDTDKVVKLRYTWAAGETNALAAGKYRVNFHVLFGNTDQETFPNNDYILVEVYNPPTGQIIANREEYNDIRAYIGLDPQDLTDPAIKGLMFLGAAELVIRKTVNEMATNTNGAVPTVTQILAGQSPATSDDLLALKMAVCAYVAFQFYPSATNAINTSETKTVGPVSRTVDRGGIGAQWQLPMQIGLEQAGVYLRLITGWPDQIQTIFALGGPTSGGYDPNTVSGFWVR